MQINHLKLNIDELKDYCTKHSIFMFGSGVQGVRAVSYFSSWNIQNHIMGFIDNDKNKQGTQIDVENSAYEIYSLDKVVEIIKPDTGILIVSLYHKAMLEQLRNYQSDKIIDCIVLDEVAEKELYCGTYATVVKDNDIQLIPKKIHYAWLGDEEPDYVKKNIENWHIMCPDYEIIKWNEDNYDVTKNRYMRQAYENKIWGFVPDYLRLDVVYDQGGIYLDTDISIVKNLDELLYQKCFASVDATLTMNLGSGFGAQPKCEIIKELRDYYDDVDFIDKDGNIDRTSCNSHSYKVLRKYGVQINNKLQRIKEMNIYPEVFQGACAHTRKENITDKTYLVHYGEMSWLKEKVDL